MRSKHFTSPGLIRWSLTQWYTRACDRHVLRQPLGKRVNYRSLIRPDYCRDIWDSIAIFVPDLILIIFWVYFPHLFVKYSLSWILQMSCSLQFSFCNDNTLILLCSDTLSVSIMWQSSSTHIVVKESFIHWVRTCCQCNCSFLSTWMINLNDDGHLQGFIFTVSHVTA